MKKLAFIFATLLISACSSAELARKQTPEEFTLTNVNIVNVETKTIDSGKAILIKDGKIKQILNIDDFTPNKHVRVIDGKGGFVVPGLIDMHVHMYEEAAFVLALSHGVTHVRIMNGVPAQLAWRDKVQQGLLLGSSSSVSSPILSAYDGLLHHEVLTKAEAIAAVNKYNAMGYDLIKAYGNLSEEALTAVIDESKKLGIPVAKHGPHASGDLPVSILSGSQSLEHVEDIFQGPLNYEFSTEKLPNAIAEIKATDVPVTPTLNIFSQLTRLSHEKDDYLSKTHKEYTSDIIALESSHNQVARWLTSSEKMAAHNQKTLRFLLEITNKMHEMGVPLLVGSDSGVLLSPHGIATHNEMKLLKQAGLTSFDVLEAATINAAIALKMDDKIGKIAPAMHADFIYSQSNPIDDLAVLTNPEAVVKNGLWLDNQSLKAMRKEAIASRSLWQEFKVLAQGL